MHATWRATSGNTGGVSVEPDLDQICNGEFAGAVRLLHAAVPAACLRPPACWFCCCRLMLLVPASTVACS